MSFGLYIHWPFCVSKCPYCDFNSHVRASIDEQRWCQALLRELNHIGQETKGRELTSVFFGGGTPSLMTPQTVGQLLDALATHWRLSPQLEITLEANPNSVDLAKFQAFKQAGINRVSLGIQSLYDHDLKFLGRSHGRVDALKALKVAERTFDRFSFDLIYARPEQTLKAWRQEIDEAMTYAQGHLSLYQLTIEPGTAFYVAHRRGEWQLPDEEESRAFYELTSEVLSRHDYRAYEISNYARPGEECQHNLTYWRYDDFAGIGPGAHGRLRLNGKRYATQCRRAPEAWLQSVEQFGHGIESREELSVRTQVIEMLLMGLRLREGIPLALFHEIAGMPFEAIVEQNVIDKLQGDDLVMIKDESLKATAHGSLLLNYVIEKIESAILCPA